MFGLFKRNKSPLSGSEASGIDSASDEQRARVLELADFFKDKSFLMVGGKTLFGGHDVRDLFFGPSDGYASLVPVCRITSSGEVSVNYPAYSKGLDYLSLLGYALDLREGLEARGIPYAENRSCALVAEELLRERDRIASSFDTLVGRVTK